MLGLPRRQGYLIVRVVPAIRSGKGRLALRTGRQRRAGGGRKRGDAQDGGPLAALESLGEPATRGEPQSPLQGTSKRRRELARERKARGHVVGRTTVGKWLTASRYSLRANRKPSEGKPHPARAAQCQPITVAASKRSRVPTSLRSPSTPTRRKTSVSPRLPDARGGPKGSPCRSAPRLPRPGQGQGGSLRRLG